MKIEIRKAKPKDAEGIAKVFEDGFRMKNFIYTGRNKKMGKDKIKKGREEYKKKNPDFYCFVAIDKEIDKVIGSSTAFFKKEGRLRHRAELAWSIHPDYQGKGISTKVVKEILKFLKKKGFKKIEAECAIKNIASWKMAKKCGFKIEGIKEKGLLMDNGRYLDTYMMGKILK